MVLGYKEKLIFSLIRFSLITRISVSRITRIYAKFSLIFPTQNALVKDVVAVEAGKDAQF
jgi:hypothetical protein